ncbi:MAG TPA: ribonuclease P protein component [Usitatibacter sp.]|jgi:ribonuclease P protein component|nr:ribonuclease P protein component [Usitatibacter sp.]
MPRDARKHGLSRRHRFAQRGSYGTVLKSGHKLRGRFAMLHAGRSLSGHSRLGIALTRKMIPRAVERNRVRRLVREAFRRHMAKQLPMDCVVTLRQAVPAADLPQFRSELETLLDQLCRKA